MVRWVLLFVAAAVAVRAILTLLFIFAARIGYPMPLEWMEGGLLLHAHRLMQGKTLYGPDTAVFIPFTYPPGYAILTGAAGVFGLDFWTGRLVSILGFTAFCVVVFHSVRSGVTSRLTGVALGVIAIATVAIGFPVVGGWYDLARVDSAYVGLCAVGAWGVSAARYTVRRMVIIAAVLTLAIYTKQTAALFAIWIVVFAMVRNWRKGLLLGALTLAACAVALVFWQWRSGGYFWHWIFRTMASHEIRTPRIWQGAKLIHGFAPFAVLIPLAAAILMWRRCLGRHSVLWLGMLVCALPASVVPYAKVGGYLNNLMPAVMLAGPVAILLATDLIRHAGRGSQPVLWATLALAAVWIWNRPMDPADFVPSQEMQEHAVALNEFIASVDGSVSIPHLPFLAIRNGHEDVQWHISGYRDMDVAHRPYDIDRTLERVNAEWLILPSRDHTKLARTLRARYHFVRKISADKRVGMMSGYQVVLDQLYRRRAPMPTGQGTRAATP